MQEGKSGYDDAFARALKEAFGDHASPERIRHARGLYARHRTDDMLKRLQGVASKNANKGDARGPPDDPPGTGDQPR